jgi:hypothetical protein
MSPAYKFCCYHRVHFSYTYVLCLYCTYILSIRSKTGSPKYEEYVTECTDFSLVACMQNMESIHDIPYSRRLLYVRVCVSKDVTREKSQK